MSFSFLDIFSSIQTSQIVVNLERVIFYYYYFFGSFFNKSVSMKPKPRNRYSTAKPQIGHEGQGRGRDVLGTLLSGRDSHKSLFRLYENDLKIRGPIGPHEIISIFPYVASELLFSGARSALSSQKKKKRKNTCIVHYLHTYVHKPTHSHVKVWENPIEFLLKEKDALFPR